MLVFVTYPLIFVVSFWAFQVGIMPGKKPLILVLGWFVLTLGLIVALGLTGCRDPGIFYRHARPPPQVSRRDYDCPRIGCRAFLFFSQDKSLYHLLLVLTAFDIFLCLPLLCCLLFRTKTIGGGMTKHKRGVHETHILIPIQPLWWKSLIILVRGQG